MSSDDLSIVLGLRLKTEGQLMNEQQRARCGSNRSDLVPIGGAGSGPFPQATWTGFGICPPGTDCHERHRREQVAAVVSRRAARAAEILWSAVSPGDEVHGARTDLHPFARTRRSAGR
jgi:hypothetical protein